MINMKHNKKTLKNAVTLASCALLLGTISAHADPENAGTHSGVDGLTIKWDAPEQARSNQAFDYTLTVTNSNETPLTNVMVYQMTPSDFEISSSEPVFEPSYSDEMTPEDRRESYRQTARYRGAEVGTAPAENTTKTKDSADHGTKDSVKTSWNLGTLNPAESRVIKVQGIAAKEGSFDTCFWATSQPVFCQTIQVVKPDLEIVQNIVDEKGNDRNVFFACEPIIINYIVSNPGTGDLTDVNAMVDMPEGFTTVTDNTSSVAIGNLKSGESKEFSVSLQPSQTGNFSISGTAKSDALTAQTRTESVEIVKPELSIRADAPRETYFGREVTYQVTVTNNSEVPAIDTVVTLPLDVENRRFTNSGQLIDGDAQSFSLGTLDGGESKSFSISFDPTAPATFATTVSADAYCAEAVTTDIKTVVAGIPALQIYVVDEQDPVKVGEETFYELKITNEGTAKDTKINVKGTLPKSLTFVSSEGESDITANGSELTFGTIDALEPGESVAWMIKVKGASAGQEVFKVDLNSENRTQLRSSEPTTVF